MVLGDFLWSNISTCISELEPRRVVELVGDFRCAHASVPLRFGLSGLVPDHLTQPSFLHETHSRNTQVRIIRPRVGSSGIFQWQKSTVWPDHPIYGRIIRPRGLNGNPKPKLSGGGRIIRRWVGSSDQYRPSVLVKYVENCRKMGKIQN